MKYKIGKAWLVVSVLSLAFADAFSSPKKPFTNGRRGSLVGCLLPIVKQVARGANFMAPVDTDNLNRGDSYGATNNSTILTAKDAAEAVGVKPPEEAPARKWKRAWNIQKNAMQLLQAFEQRENKLPNSSLSLYVLWWKALSGNDPNSPVFDNSLSFDLLPRGTRHVVRYPRFFPRLHHANVEIRTAYLDRAVTNIVKEVHATSSRRKKFRLVTFGAGYDIRSIKLKDRQVIDVAHELDLPDVIEAKTKLLNSKRFRRRRQQRQGSTTEEEEEDNVVVLPFFYPVDLNDLAGVENTLKDIFTSSPNDNGSDDDEWHNIFLFEAVMIYLDEGVLQALLKLCSDVLLESKESGSLCFADRLENVPGGDEAIGVQELAKTGWKLVEWLPKPGLARHMGRVELLL